MKISLSLFVAMVCLASLAHAADPKPGPDAVVVKVLDTPMPREARMQSRFLWDTFANKPEEKQFKCYTMDKWRDNYAVFAKTLVQKARDQKLDAESLRQVLNQVLKHAKGGIFHLGYGLAYLPVGAYQTTLDGKLIWIVVVKWEGKEGELGHIRMFAFDQKTLKQVAFKTCR